MSKTSNTTGIGVRKGFLQLGGLTTQPIPFVSPATFPVSRIVSPIVPAIAPPAVANALQTGTTPQLPIAVSDIVNGNISTAVEKIIPKSLNTVQIRPVAGDSPIQIIPPILSNQRKLEEVLSLSRLKFSDGLLQQANPHGISELRPEIISLLDFKPVYAGPTLTFNSVGLLMDVQYQARQLREQTFFQIMSEIQQSDQKNELQNLQTSFANNFRRVNAAADFYKNTIQTIETIKSGFAVKNIPPSNFDLQNYRTLREFFQTFMSFPTDAFDRFTGTKILMQLLFDAKSIAEGYSMTLLNLTDPDRQSGGPAVTSPISIDKSYNTRAGFGFTYNTIRSFNAPQNASDQGFMRRFNAALPQPPDDRIKLLINLFSKELRVSRGLGRTNVQTSLRQKFNATTTDGSPFNSIFGVIGNSVFDPITETSSIASLTSINNTDNTVVFPFETKYIDINNNTKKSYIPGTSFFVDSILNVQSLSSFNLNPLKGYVSRFAEVVDNATEIISAIFDYSNEISPLSPVSVLKLMLEPISQTLGSLATNNRLDGVGLSVSEATATATFRLAVSDPELKSLLFQYILLQIISTNTRSSFFAQNIIEDLNRDIRNLSGVPVDEASSTLPNLQNPQELFPYITALAQAIQSRIVLLINQQNLSNGSNAQARSRPSESNGLSVVGYDVDINYGIAASLQHSQLIRQIVKFFSNIDVLLGNEINNLMDSARKTRYNSLSGSTLVLLIFEAFVQLISRFIACDFQTSSYGENFPNMLVDVFFNAKNQNSIQNVIAEPQLPLPIMEFEPETGSKAQVSSVVLPSQRGVKPQISVASQYTLEQAPKTATMLGSNSATVQNGILGNEPILSGPFATAGSRFTDAAALALRNVGPAVNPQALLDAHAVDLSLNSLFYKLFQEDFTIACIMHILQVIKKSLKNSLDLATNYFTQQTLNSLLTLNATSIQDIAQNLDPAQVRIMLQQRDSFVRQLTPNSQKLQFISQSPTDSDARGALLGLLGQGQFRETNDASLRYKLLTIGIPAGFSRNLIERVNGDNLASSAFFRDKEKDVITVNIYKRSLEFPQLIFKPKKYIFDLSLFSGGYRDLRIRPNENFELALQRISLLDYQNFLAPTTTTLSQIINGARYDFIPEKSKRELMQNHVLSDLLASYIQSLTTMKLDELTFVNQQSQTYQKLSVGDGTDLSPQFSELVKKYLIAKRTEEIRKNPNLAPLPDIPIRQMLIHPAVDQATKDLLKVLTFGNIAFKLENVLASLLSPKIFERVFTIPVNVDEFEIDYKQTTASESGREFFSKNFLQQQLDKKSLASGIYKLSPRTNKNITFEDYFVTVELVE